MPTENRSSNTEKMVSVPFQREDRYIVIKRSDLAKRHPKDREMLQHALWAIGRSPREYLVIESDWPEYEPAWQMIERRVSGVAGWQPEVVAVINEEGEHFKETVVEHRPGIDRLPVGTELVDRAHVTRLQAERDGLQMSLNTADQTIDDLNSAIARRTKRVRELEAQVAELVEGMNQILRVTKIGDEAFGIAAPVIGELSASTEPEPPSYTEYVTQPGESLMGIANRQLRSSERWVEIRDLNAHAFPDMLHHSYYPVGTAIKLPA